MKQLREIVPLEEKNWHKAGKIHSRLSIGRDYPIEKYGPLKHVLKWVAPSHLSHIHRIRKELNDPKNKHFHDVANKTNWRGKSTEHGSDKDVSNMVQNSRRLI